MKSSPKSSSSDSLKFKRVCILVLDSLGVGELLDAADYNDRGANTLLNTYKALGGLQIPHLASLGLLEIVKPGSTSKVRGYYGRMCELSKGKDTATGHWEMMGLVIRDPFHTFLNGFPEDLMKEWSKAVGLGFIGNKAASGTAIIDELGAEHLQTQKPIVYTSADSVFQIAAHEEAFGLKKLHDLCAKTRTFLNQSPYKIGRVIARPFLGQPGSFKRTENRKDYALSPFAKTALDLLLEAGFETWGIGKIPSIYNYHGITKQIEAHNDREALEASLQALRELKRPGLIFSNLNDLDMLYGHRRNVKGYGSQIEFIDSRLGEIMSLISEDDLLILTADHGNDPTYKGSDHTREYTPLLVYNPCFGEAPAQTRKLLERKTFADIGQSLCENYGLQKLSVGESFIGEISAK